MKIFEQGQKKTGSCWLVEDQGLLLLAIHKLLARYVGSHDMRVRNMIFKPRQTMSFVFNLRIYPSKTIYCDLFPFFTNHFIKTLEKRFYTIIVVKDNSNIFTGIHISQLLPHRLNCVSRAVFIILVFGSHLRYFIMPPFLLCIQVIYS